MFFDFILLRRQSASKLAVAWSVATIGIKSKVKQTTRETLMSINVSKLCDEIVPFLSSNSSERTERMSLRLSAMLTSGCVRILQFQYNELTIALENFIELLIKLQMETPESPVATFTKPKVPSDGKRKVPATETSTSKKKRTDEVQPTQADSEFLHPESIPEIGIFLNKELEDGLAPTTSLRAITLPDADLRPSLGELELQPGDTFGIASKEEMDLLGPFRALDDLMEKNRMSEVQSEAIQPILEQSEIAPPETALQAPIDQTPLRAPILEAPAPRVSPERRIAPSPLPITVSRPEMDYKTLLSTGVLKSNIKLPQLTLPLVQNKFIESFMDVDIANERQLFNFEVEEFLTEPEISEIALRLSQTDRTSGILNGFGQVTDIQIPEKEIIIEAPPPSLMQTIPIPMEGELPQPPTVTDQPPVISEVPPIMTEEIQAFRGPTEEPPAVVELQETISVARKKRQNTIQVLRSLLKTSDDSCTVKQIVGKPYTRKNKLSVFNDLLILRRNLQIIIDKVPGSILIEKVRAGPNFKVDFL